MCHEEEKSCSFSYFLSHMSRYAMEVFSGTLFAVSLSDGSFRVSFPSFLFGVPFFCTLPSRKGNCES